MGLNVSTAMGFENKEFLRNTAKDILTQSGASKEALTKIINETIFDKTNGYSNSQLAVLRASAQVTISKSLDETLKYLKSHAYKKENKKPILGELWNIISTNNQQSEENPYKGELYDFKINKNAKNIFAAA